MFRTLLVGLVAALFCAGGVALAAPGNGDGNGNGGGNGNGNGGGNGQGCQHAPKNPNCTYPAVSNTQLLDANGNPVDGTHGLHVGDPVTIVSDGWLPSSMVGVDFFSTVIHLGDFAADSTGTVRAGIRIPSVEPGEHTLHLSGTGADGQPRVVDYPILVAPASNVLASTLGKASGSGGSGVFGKTGLDHARDIAGVGLALLAVGVVLTLAVRRSRAGTAF